VAAVLADGRIAEGRGAPARAVGPDLDHLTLGGGARLSIVAAAWIRLFPVTPQLGNAWSCPDLGAALAALEGLCRKRLAPARARIQATPEGTRLALAWEGIESAAIAADRAERELQRSLSRERDVQPNWVRESAAGHPVEVDTRWSRLRAWSPYGDMHLVGLHAGGTFAVLSLPEARGAEDCAALARAAGMRVIAPRRLRDAGPGWDAAGAGPSWSRLLEALGV
jgi:hypothetical protein